MDKIKDVKIKPKLKPKKEIKRNKEGEVIESR